MKNVMFVALLCCCLLITPGTADQPVRDVRIENCIEKFIDIRENANNTILCRGFYPNDTIVWKFKRNDENITNGVATCDPSSNCTVHQPDHFAAERSPSHTTLFYQQYDRKEDALAIVTCESQFAGGPRSIFCTLNVINPAKLSSCAVEEDREKGTARGRCRFEQAYSYSRGFKCTWNQKVDDESRSFHGNITYDSVSQGPSGWCTFTSKDLDREPGTYTYSINFYPGPGNITVSNKNEPDVNSVPVEAIVGGIAAVVAIIGVLVVGVVVIRRKRRQKPAGSANGSGDVPLKENNDFEEHVNPMYVTSEDQNDTRTTDHKPSAIALRISSNSHNGHPAAPQSLEADMYTTVDGEARFVPSSAAGRSGGYGDTGFGSNGNKRVPQKDEYAVVDTSRAKEDPALSANTSASSPAHTTEGSGEYAVVDKSSSRHKAAKNVAFRLSDAATSNACAQVDKSAKKVKVAEPEAKRAAYAQVQKPKPAAKPKTSAKPSSNKDVTCRGAADDDEYHTLSHTRGSTHTQDQADLESQYSHISQD
ncbi:uncharacterized protein [Littorina saxatilis]|uniref:uncharacterized protein n=1 Tax=Littorina saxatilis TaxID=31220 RepID=UPI0038B454C5